MTLLSETDPMYHTLAKGIRDSRKQITLWCALFYLNAFAGVWNVAGTLTATHSWWRAMSAACCLMSAFISWKMWQMWVKEVQHLNTLNACLNAENSEQLDFWLDQINGEKKHGSGAS